MVTSVLYDFAFMSVLLIVSKILRAKISFIQKLYIPSALLAGFLGLFLGKQFLNVIPFSSDIGSYAGILIAFLFGSMILGNKYKTSFKSMIGSVGDTFLINGASEIFQFAFFILIGIVILPKVFPSLNEYFGLMLPAGFVGGHGTAAAIGSVFAENGWEDAKSIGQTFATIGLLGGIVFGVIIINIGTRKHQTAVIKEVKALPEDLKTGLVSENNRTAFGENTVSSMSIDTLTWHFALVLTAVGSAYLVNKGLKILFPKLSFPIYGLALLCSIVLWGLLKLIKLDTFVDKRIVTHIGSSATDYLVAFGVASINISIVVKYWQAILVVAVIGFVVVIAWFYLISPKFFRNYWFEHGIYIFGMSTGVLATGVILLRITDPDLETGVLEDFGFAWIFLSIVDMLLVSLSPMFMVMGNGIVYSIVLLMIAIACLMICRGLNKITVNNK